VLLATYGGGDLATDQDIAEDLSRCSGGTRRIYTWWQIKCETKF
jgi:hypothetical protein